MVSESDVVEALIALGFNRNEGRGYATLLRLGPSTGYEVSQRSGMPRSAVYAVLRRLVDAGAARAIAGSPERFIATPPDSLLNLLETRFSASGKALREAIEQLDARPAAPDAFSVKGYARVMEEAARIAASAEQKLVLSGWPREIATLEKEVQAAHARGVYVVVFSHGRLSATLPGVRFSYGMPEEGLESFWEHRLTLVADDTRSLIAAAEQHEHDTAVVSEAAAIAEFAVGYVALDITLLAQRHGRDVSDVMAKMLGDRVGRLDSLLEGSPEPEIGRQVGGARKRKRATKKRAAPSGSASRSSRDR
jgi:sugar-specific transcriptional regulator TrmB